MKKSTTKNLDKDTLLVNAKKALKGLTKGADKDTATTATSSDDATTATNIAGSNVKLDEESIKALEKSLMDLALHYLKMPTHKEGETKLLLAFTEQLTKSGIDKSMAKTIATK